MNPGVNLSRRSLLTGGTAAVEAPVRPPGAVVEALFTDRCTSCGDCASACPENIVIRGSGGYPQVDFRRGECTFCSRCIDACEDNALQHEIRPPWRLAISVQDNCLANRQVVCQSCGDACDTRAITFKPRIGAVATPAIEADRCTGCGACIAACPEDALKAAPHGG